MEVAAAAVVVVIMEVDNHFHSSCMGFKCYVRDLCVNYCNESSVGFGVTYKDC